MQKNIVSVLIGIHFEKHTILDSYEKNSNNAYKVGKCCGVFRVAHTYLNCLHKFERIKNILNTEKRDKLYLVTLL